MTLAELLAKLTSLGLPGDTEVVIDVDDGPFRNLVDFEVRADADGRSFLVIEVQ